MKRWILLLMLILALACPPLGWCADKKVTALPLDNAPTSDDQIMIVDNPGGSPASKKTTVGDVINSGSLIKTLSGDVVASGGGTSSTATIQPQTVTETKLLLSDTTTGNVSTAKHGFAPKLSNSATTYLDGTGAWTTPAGTGGEGGGTGDVVGPSSSVDGEIAVFSGVGGKTIKRSTSTGILKSTSGVIGTASAGTDYLAPNGSGSNLTGVAKTSGSYTNGNLLCAGDTSGNPSDCGVAPPVGDYGNMNGVASSTSDYLMAFDGTDGKQAKQTGCHVTGAGKDELVCKSITAETATFTGDVPNKFGNVSGGDYFEFSNTDGTMSAHGDAVINWDTVNLLNNDNINWTNVQLNTEGVNWVDVYQLTVGGGSGTPGGSDTQVQINDSSSFGGDAGFTYNKTSDLATLAGGLSTSQTSAPTIAAGAAAGTSPTIQYQGSNGSGLVYLYTGSSTTTGTVATITYSKTYSHYPAPIIAPANDNARAARSAGAEPYADVSSGSTTTAVLKNAGTALTAGTTYIWSLNNIGR